MTSLSDLAECLRELKVKVDTVTEFASKGHGAAMLVFSDGSSVRMQYWRLHANGRFVCSSLEHQERYGLPEAIDAPAELSAALDGRTCVDAAFDPETCDLTFSFEPNFRLQVFRFTGHEDWELAITDSFRALSNFAGAR